MTVGEELMNELRHLLAFIRAGRGGSRKAEALLIYAVPDCQPVVGFCLTLENMRKARIADQLGPLNRYCPLRCGRTIATTGGFSQGSIERKMTRFFSSLMSHGRVPLGGPGTITW